MTAITRRALAAATAAVLLAARQARAQGPSPVTRALPKTYSGSTLNLVWGPEPVNQAMANFSQEFGEATGIKLVFNGVAHTERYQKIILDTTSNTNSFDIYLNAYQWKNELAPFVIDHAKIDQEVKGAPPLDLDDYPKRALDVYGRVGDKLMAIPLNGSVTFLVWNKKAFAKAGLDPERGPKNWDEVISNGEKLRSGNQYGYNLPAGKNIQACCNWITLFAGFGGVFFDDKGLPQFTGPASLKAMQTMAERLEKISPPGNLTWDNPEMITAVASGQSAQGFMWTGAFSTLLDPAKSVVADGLGYGSTPEAALLGGWAVSVNAKSKNLDAAKLFVAWLTSKEICGRLAPITGQPARVSAFREPEVQRKFPVLAKVLEGLQGPLAEYPPIKQSEQICIYIYNAANAVCAGQMTPAQGCEDIQAKSLDFMKRRGLMRT